MTKNVANNIAQANSQDYVKKSHNVQENEPKSEKNLTKLWKKGKLVRGCLYYVKLGDSIAEVLLDGDNDFIYNGRIITPEVLAYVPSYKEWQQMKAFCEEFNALNVAEENQKLKELLKECWKEIKTLWDKALYDNGDRMPYSDRFIRLDKLKTKIDEVLK